MGRQIGEGTQTYFVIQTPCPKQIFPQLEICAQLVLRVSTIHLEGLYCCRVLLQIHFEVWCQQ